MSVRDPAPPVRTFRGSLWPLFLVALLLRALHQWRVATDDLLSVPVGDAAHFLEWARFLASGEDLTADVYYQAPLYPYLAALLFSLGGGLLALRVAAVLAGALSCIVLARGARGLVGERASRSAGWLLAVYPPAIHYEALFEKTGLAVFLVCLLVAALSRARRAPGVGSGLLLGGSLGLLCLTRENMIALLPLLVLAGAPARAGAPAGRRVRTLLGLFAGLLVALLPLALRNSKAAGPGADGLLPANLGPNLFIGNHAGADGLYQSLVPGRGRPGAEQEDARRLAGEALGLTEPPGAGAASRFWAGQALTWMGEHPGSAVGLLMRKVALLLHPREWMDSTSFEVHRGRSPVLRLLAPVVGLPLILALVLAAALGPRRRRTRPLVGLAALALVSVAVFFVFGRFRMAFLPLLLPVAGLGLQDLRDLLRSSRGGSPNWFSSGRSLRVAGSFIAGLLGSLALSLVIDADGLERPHVDSFTSAGFELEALGRDDGARAAYLLALEGDDEDANALFNLGKLEARLGQLEEAGVHLERAVLARPAYLAEAHLVMARALAAGGDPMAALRVLDEARRADPSWPEPLVEQGILLRQLGRSEDARLAYAAALELAPGHANALNNLGYLEELEGRWELARRLYESSLRTDPRSRAARVNLARLLARAPASPGVVDVAAGERALELLRSLEQDPEELELLQLLAAALARAGRFGEASELAARALAVASAEGQDPESLDGIRAELAAYRAGRPGS